MGEARYFKCGMQIDTEEYYSVCVLDYTEGDVLGVT